MYYRSVKWGRQWPRVYWLFWPSLSSFFLKLDLLFILVKVHMTHTDPQGGYSTIHAVAAANANETKKVIKHVFSVSSFQQ